MVNLELIISPGSILPYGKRYFNEKSVTHGIKHESHKRGEATLFINGTIKGDIHGKTDIKINESAVVVGNIDAENLSAQGKIKGNLQVRGTTEISESALIVGDIMTNDITSEKGCIINGKITTKDRMKFDFEDDKLFQITE